MPSPRTSTRSGTRAREADTHAGPNAGGAPRALAHVEGPHVGLAPATAPQSVSRPAPPASPAAAHPAAREAGFISRLGRVGVVVAAFGLAVAFSVPLCPFALLTGHPCPGCGLTRATLALLHGDVAASLHFHPLAMVISPLVGGIVGYDVFVYLRSGRSAATQTLQGRWVTIGAVVLGVVAVAVWIARFFGWFGGPVPV